METEIAEAEVAKPQSGELTIAGKVFKYKINPIKKPYKWATLEIFNSKAESIKIFFNPNRQDLLKEIRKQVRFHKWVKIKKNYEKG